MAKENIDDKTLKLIDEVKKRKAEIAKAERPVWKTNCTFSYNEKLNDSMNLRVVKDVVTLLRCAAFLKREEQDLKAISKELQVDVPEFHWGGHTVSEWLDDIKTRIAIIQISSKKEQLEKLENRLNAIISPELKRILELEAIEAELT